MNKPIKSWINKKLVELIDIRREHKNLKTEESQNEYKKYRNLVNRETRRVKEEWLESTHSAVNNYLDKDLCDKVYKIIKQFFGTHKGKSKILRGKDGKIIMNNRERLVV